MQVQPCDGAGALQGDSMYCDMRCDMPQGLERTCDRSSICCRTCCSMAVGSIVASSPSTRIRLLIFTC